MFSLKAMVVPGPSLRCFGWTRSVLTIVFGLLSMLAGGVEAQIGVSLCACQPATYEMTFNFSLTESDQNVEGEGILDDEFVIANLDQPDNITADVVPVRVSTITILELDQSEEKVVAQTVLTEGYTDGSTFTYTSNITDWTTLTTSSLPKGFQLIFEGENEAGDDIQQFSIVLYENDCSIFPILFEGQNFGWITFTDLGSPPKEMCPNSDTTVSPTASPTLEGTAAHSDEPTFETAAPTAAPIPLEDADPKNELIQSVSLKGSTLIIKEGPLDSPNIVQADLSPLANELIQTATLEGSILTIEEGPMDSPNTVQVDLAPAFNPTFVIQATALDIRAKYHRSRKLADTGANEQSQYLGVNHR